MNESIVSTLTQLFVQSPLLLVYLVGIFLAPAFLSRFPPARNLVVIGCGLLLLTSILSTFAFQSLIYMRASRGWSTAEFGTLSGAIGIVGSLAHAIGVALLLAAAFNSRREPMVAAQPQR